MMQSRSAMAPFLLVVSLVGLVGILAVAPAVIANLPRDISFKSPPKEMDWGLTPVTVLPAITNSWVLDGIDEINHSSWDKVNLPQDGPQPPQKGCDHVSRLTGFPCEYEVFRQKGVNYSLFDVVVRSGRVVATLRVFEAPIRAIGAEYALCFETGGFCFGASRIWMASINVARGLQNQGFGRYMYDLSNYLARINTPASEPVVRYFSDTAGWGPSVIQNTGRVLQVGTEYLYLIPSAP